MRVATLEVGKPPQVLEIVVSQFPGDVGGILANVNRWRQQVGLEPVTDAQLPELVEAFDNGSFTGHTMRLDWPQQTLIGAAIYEPAADRTWFVKALGPPAVIDLHEQEVFQFSRSFGAGASDAEANE